MTERVLLVSCDDAYWKALMQWLDGSVGVKARELPQRPANEVLEEAVRRFEELAANQRERGYLQFAQETHTLVAQLRALDARLEERDGH